MDFSRIKVTGERLRKDLEDLGRFGEEPGGGILRLALSEADLKAREWFKARMEQAGLKVCEDAAANIIGRLESSSGPPGGPCIATGSHIDAVPHGGKFDGAAGICAGLEALRAVGESGIRLPVPLELIVFTDEEGGHFAGTFGSRAMFGLLGEREVYKSRGEGRPSLADRLKGMGKNPGRIDGAARSPSEFRAFLELHIEQGPVLDSLRIPIGVVEGIVFIDRYSIRVEGNAGHAGTVPMNLRDDALVKAAGLVTTLNRLFRSAGPGLVGTIGEMKVLPGAFNIIPGSVEMSLDLRSMWKTPLERVRGRMRKIIRSVEGAGLEMLNSKGGVRMDPAVMNALILSCRERGVGWKRLGSGAGHDAMTFPAQGIPAGMIFIPCKGGKSHCPEEAIRWEDAALGAQILADTVVRMALDPGSRKRKERRR